MAGTGTDPPQRRPSTQPEDPANGQAERAAFGHDLDDDAYWRPGRRFTQNVDVLVIEAKLYHDDGDPGNPAFPMNERVKQRALQELNSVNGGITPVWIDFTDFPTTIPGHEVVSKHE